MSYNGGMAKKLYKFIHSGTLGRGVAPKDLPDGKDFSPDLPEKLADQEDLKQLFVGKKTNENTVPTNTQETNVLNN